VDLSPLVAIVLLQIVAMVLGNLLVGIYGIGR
jgi:YggT family protein